MIFLFADFYLLMGAIILMLVFVCVVSLRCVRARQTFPSQSMLLSYEAEAI